VKTLLRQFEWHAEIDAASAAKLLGCPLPTYYQYRRADKMPDVVKRFVEILMSIPKETLEDLIRKHVHGRDDEL